MNKLLIRGLEIVILGVLAFFTLGEVPTQAENCAESQSACEECCNDAFQCCVTCGGTATSDCEYDPPACWSPGCANPPSGWPNCEPCLEP